MYKGVDGFAIPVENDDIFNLHFQIKDRTSLFCVTSCR